MKRKYGVGSDGTDTSDAPKRKKKEKDGKPKKKRKSVERRSSQQSSSVAMELGSPPGLNPSEYRNTSFDSDESMPKRRRKTSMLSQFDSFGSCDSTIFVWYRVKNRSWDVVGA